MIFRAVLLYCVHGLRALVAIPALIALFWRFLSSCADRAYIRVVTAWRASRLARRPNEFYCPECVRPLRDANSDGAARRECPSCMGVWQPSLDVTPWLTGDQAQGVSWRPQALEEDRLPLQCPRCAAVLEDGSWTGFPSFARCSACRGQWVPRFALLSLEMRPRASR